MLSNDRILPTKVDKYSAIHGCQWKIKFHSAVIGRRAPGICVNSKAIEGGDQRIGQAESWPALIFSYSHTREDGCIGDDGQPHSRNLHQSRYLWLSEDLIVQKSI